MPLDLLLDSASTLTAPEVTRLIDCRKVKNNVLDEIMRLDERRKTKIGRVSTGLLPKQTNLLVISH